MEGSDGAAGQAEDGPYAQIGAHTSEDIDGSLREQRAR